MEYAREPTSSEDYESLLQAVIGDPIATLRAAIRMVQHCRLL